MVGALIFGQQGWVSIWSRHKNGQPRNGRGDDSSHPPGSQLAASKRLARQDGRCEGLRPIFGSAPETSTFPSTTRTTLYTSTATTIALIPTTTRPSAARSSKSRASGFSAARVFFGGRPRKKSALPGKRGPAVITDLSSLKQKACTQKLQLQGSSNTDLSSLKTNPFLGEGSPTSIASKKSGTLILTSPLEHLDKTAWCPKK